MNGKVAWSTSGIEGPVRAGPSTTGARRSIVPVQATAELVPSAFEDAHQPARSTADPIFWLVAARIGFYLTGLAS